MQKRSVSVSAPGKLMLFGEHAVVYGRPSIVTAVDQRMRATVTLTDESYFELCAPEVQIEKYKKGMSSLGEGDIPKGARFAEHAVKHACAMCGYRGGVRIETSSDFHAQFGFGSSSASTTCVVGGLLWLFQGSFDRRTIFDVSYKAVLAVQGKGSGFDLAAATYGGTLFFITPGATIEPLNLSALPLFIGYTGVKADTVTIVNEVLVEYGKNPTKIESLYDAMGDCACRARDLLTASNWQELGVLMNENQKHLQALGVSSPILDRLIAASLGAGAYGAKLSGAGRGDCMITFAPSEKKDAVQVAIEEAGGTFIDIRCNAEGLRLE